MHKDKILHLLSLMKSHSIKLDEEDSWILGKMAMLLTLKPDSIDAFAGESMQIFINHAQFRDTKRICLVKRIGLSNCIVVKSCKHLLQKDNTMPPGYSCFVDSQGSLFQLRATELRLYADASKIAESYAKVLKPVHRSIDRIAKMGLKSGLCLPLYHKNRSIGFLFMNTENEGFSNLRDSAYCILSYYKAVATLVLLQSDQPSEAFYSLAQHHPSSSEANILTESGFIKILDLHLRSLDCSPLKTDITISCPEVLVSIGTIANLLSRLICLLKASSITVKVQDQQDKILWTVGFLGGQELRPEFLPASTIWDDFKAMELPFRIEDQQLHFSLNFEQADSQHRVRYSI